MIYALVAVTAFFLGWLTKASWDRALVSILTRMFLSGVGKRKVMEEFKLGFEKLAARDALEKVPDGPINQEEMVELFGSTMPIEAVNLLFDPNNGDKTLQQLRRELREIAYKKKLAE